MRLLRAAKQKKTLLHGRLGHVLPAYRIYLPPSLSSLSFTPSSSLSSLPTLLPLLLPLHFGCSVVRISHHFHDAFCILPSLQARFFYFSLPCVCVFVRVHLADIWICLDNASNPLFCLLLSSSFVSFRSKFVSLLCSFPEEDHLDFRETRHIRAEKKKVRIFRVLFASCAHAPPEDSKLRKKQSIRVNHITFNDFFPPPRVCSFFPFSLVPSVFYNGMQMVSFFTCVCLFDQGIHSMVLFELETTFFFLSSFFFRYSL